MTDNVNLMADNLTGQVRNIAEVTTAVARGDLSKKITVDVKGEILALKSTINTMVDQLNSFASEVTRVAREVGSEGMLGGQARVEGVGGIWKDLTDNVNMMAANLTGQVRNIAEVTTAVANGDLSKKITVDVKGEILALKSTINTMVDQLNSFASEVTRVAWEVGIEGKLGGQAQVRGVAGTWKDLTDNVNMMASNLTGQVRNIADVTTAVANGDLSKKITVDVKGEILELKSTINTMVDQLNSFASEVTRVAREVGSDGKLGGQAQVRGVAGTWKDLTDNVNMMAANLTGQVRGIASVVTAVAVGDLKRKLSVDAKGEIAELADTINEMIDTLATFADQVTNVAREVGVEGKLGGQARVPSAAGLWRDLTDNVNQLAANLSTRVRAIAEVATAVTKGDLTRSISVAASGEVAALKDNINEIIRNLRDTTHKNAEQDWLKTNLARFTRMLQGERDLVTVSNLILSELAPLVNAQRGVFYVVDRDEENEPVLDLVASYAFTERKNLSNRFRFRQGLVGQCAYERKRIVLTNVPPDYITIGSALGETPPLNIIVLPVLFEQDLKAVIEIASLGRFSETHQSFLDQLMESIGIVLNTIAANMQTESLLKQSQTLTIELQSQQEELKKTNDRLEQQAATLNQSQELLKTQQEQLKLTNEELEEKARLLLVQKEEVESKNREVSIAKAALEEKAEQLQLTSHYKSQFLANISHELRTPLNSLLILSKVLAENSDGNLTDKQREFAKTINSAGSDLLALINDVLDLSKIESGTVTLEINEVRFSEIVEQMERTFPQVAAERGLEFAIQCSPKLASSLRTDPKRLQQVLRNLLSNAFKFTERGSVRLVIEPVLASILRPSGDWTAFRVVDTGIGIPADKQRIIFEAFQQADGSTNRNFGGTGLGLAISRDIAHLLGGEIEVVSELGVGSTFTLFLPAEATTSANPSEVLAFTFDGRANMTSSQRSASIALSSLEDDRASIQPGDRVALIIEDDAVSASVLLGISREQGFKGLIANDSAAGLLLARRYKTDAIILDGGLPDIDGWTVCDQLKHEPWTRNVSIHVIATDGQGKRGRDAGTLSLIEERVDREALLRALSQAKVSIDRPIRRLLIIEKDEAQCRYVETLLSAVDKQIKGVDSWEEAIRAVSESRFDCAILDLDLSEVTGIEFIERMHRARYGGTLPLIVHTGRELEAEEQRKLSELAAIVVSKSQSVDNTAEELRAFLNGVKSLDDQTRSSEIEDNDEVLRNRKVLIIDDDIRNIFSLMSALEQYGLEVSFAENGWDGIDCIRKSPGLDAVLIDIMMPVMDGYETIREIRENLKDRNLPLIAVTARAMKGDHEKCLDAGASDYVSKPIDLDRLISILRMLLETSNSRKTNEIESGSVSERITHP